ncbi:MULTISPECIES: transcriptional repressor [Metallibacterium]|jgi:Fur family zinc uptake transcriptional regulator|uniref:transcriptional repressor n=1 Tax=Metallibacterium TaxID=1218803 RepID=UPI00262F1059|nr:MULTISPECIES: transcriptional repressor [Metallibacterium]MBW8075348.1 transcriptional repressor [Metallibacterium scheffleri]
MSAQSHPHSHRNDARGYLAAVEQACRERDLRLTESRREILQLLAVHGGPAKAYDLLESLRQRHATAAPPTVYRALEFLLAHGFIHRLDSINAFVVCHHPEQAHQVPFLICDECNQAEELCDDGHVAALIAREAQRRGFAPRAQTLEVHGLCARCRDRGSAVARAAAQ